MPAYYYYSQNPAVRPPVFEHPRMCFAFDVDGTLAIGTHREHFIVRKPGDPRPKFWKDYFEHLDNDSPNLPVVEIARTLGKVHPIIYVTARPWPYIERTALWLLRQNLPLHHHIFYRSEGDFKADSELKLELLREAIDMNYKIAILFDDRKRVVMAARGAGYTVAQVADGDF